MRYQWQLWCLPVQFLQPAVFQERAGKLVEITNISETEHPIKLEILLGLRAKTALIESRSTMKKSWALKEHTLNSIRKCITNSIDRLSIKNNSAYFGLKFKT